MSKDILSVIQTNMSTFSKGQKLIAGFILESYDKAAFMTASRLGKTVNVSESCLLYTSPSPRDRGALCRRTGV